MSRIDYFASGKVNRFYNKIKEVANKENKNSLYLFFDFLICSFKYGAGLSDYVNYELYKKNKEQRKNYVTVIDCDNFYKLLSPEKYKTFFTVKPNFLNNFKKYIERDYYTNDMNFEKLNKFLNNNSSFMYKPIDGLGGHGVTKMFTKDIKDKKEFYEKLKKENAFIEGYIIQHKEMAKFASNSVNTIRIMSYANNNKSKIFYAAMRVGNGISNVDNFHQGGMGIKVDINTGSLVGKAINKKGEEFKFHPTSQVKFDGFKIPNWEYTKKMVEEAALINQNIHVVGWDVAITEKGATFVEGNRRPGWDLLQEIEHKGMKPLMNEILMEYKKDEENINE